MKKYIDIILTRLSSLLQESNDKSSWSTMRLITLFTSITIISVWAGISIYNNKLEAVPESVVFLFLIATSGKLLQKNIENKIEEKTESLTNIITDKKE